MYPQGPPRFDRQILHQDPYRRSQPWNLYSPRHTSYQIGYPPNYFPSQCFTPRFPDHPRQRVEFQHEIRNASSSRSSETTSCKIAKEASHFSEERSSQTCQSRRQGPARKRKAEGCQQDAIRTQNFSQPIQYEKELAEKEMQDYTERCFGNVEAASVIIPPVPFNQPEYVKLEKYSKHQAVFLQKEIASHSDLSCKISEHEVFDCVSHVKEHSTDANMFILYNYKYENYMCKLKSHPKEPFYCKAKTRGTTRTGTAPSKITGNNSAKSQPQTEQVYECSKSDIPKGYFVLPINLSDPSLRRGDFDFLFISTKFGFITIEIKSVGHDHDVQKNSSHPNLTEKELYNRIGKKLIQAIEQSNKSETVLTNLVGDLDSNIPVTKVLAFPNVPRHFLQEFLNKCPEVSEKFTKCLSTSKMEDALSKCLCRDEVKMHQSSTSYKFGASEDGNKADVIMEWWRKVTEGISTNSEAENTATEVNSDLEPSSTKPDVMSLDVYKKIISRFCGQFSKLTVTARKNEKGEVRTFGDYVHLTGIQFGRSILRQAQLDILESHDHLVLLKGPPGSGKTLILGLKAVEWAEAGDEVVVLGPKEVRNGSLVSWTLYNQIQLGIQNLSRSGKSGQCHFAEVTKETNAEAFVKEHLDKFRGKSLRFIMDEIPVKEEESSLQGKLSGCVSRLECVNKLLIQVVTDAEDSTRKADPQPFSKDLLTKMMQHITGIKNKLSVVQPHYGRPSVTQTTLWQALTAKIGELNDDVESIVIKLTMLTWVYSEETLMTIEAKLAQTWGFLFNIENTLVFFAVDDIFRTVSHLPQNEAVSFWSAGSFPFYNPEGFSVKELKVCLRCPPQVQQILKWIQDDLMFRPNFSYGDTETKFSLLPLPTEGPEVKLLNHREHFSNLASVNVLDCAECGKNLVDYLKETLHIGQGEDLRMEDVFIGGSFDTRKDCAFLTALQQKGIPFLFESQMLRKPPPYPGKVFVCGGSSLQGLESKIVVFLPDVRQISSDRSDLLQFRPDLPEWLQNLGRWNRCHLWYIASRTLSQLVVFHV